MPSDTAALILLPFLAAAIERVVEVVMGPVGSLVHMWQTPKPAPPAPGTAPAPPQPPAPGTEPPAPPAEIAWKRLIGLALAFVAAAAIAFGLDLDLITPLVTVKGLDDTELQLLTAIALAGGSAPVHELIRLAEEAKKKAKSTPPTPA